MIADEYNRWLRAAYLYYIEPGEDTGMSDAEWDYLSRKFYAARDQMSAPEHAVLHHEISMGAVYSGSSGASTRRALFHQRPSSGTREGRQPVACRLERSVSRTPALCPLVQPLYVVRQLGPVLWVDVNGHGHAPSFFVPGALCCFPLCGWCGHTVSLSNLFHASTALAVASLVVFPRAQTVHCPIPCGSSSQVNHSPRSQSSFCRVALTLSGIC